MQFCDGKVLQKFFDVRVLCHNVMILWWWVYLVIKWQFCDNVITNSFQYHCEREKNIKYFDMHEKLRAVLFLALLLQNHKFVVEKWFIIMCPNCHDNVMTFVPFLARSWSAPTSGYLCTKTLVPKSKILNLFKSEPEGWGFKKFKVLVLNCFMSRKIEIKIFVNNKKLWYVI